MKEVARGGSVKKTQAIIGDLVKRRGACAGGRLGRQMRHRGRPPPPPFLRSNWVSLSKIPDAGNNSSRLPPQCCTAAVPSSSPPLNYEQSFRATNMPPVKSALVSGSIPPTNPRADQDITLMTGQVGLSQFPDKDLSFVVVE